MSQECKAGSNFCTNYNSICMKSQIFWKPNILKCCSLGWKITNQLSSLNENLYSYRKVYARKVRVWRGQIYAWLTLIDRVAFACLVLFAVNYGRPVISEWNEMKRGCDITRWKWCFKCIVHSNSWLIPWVICSVVRAWQFALSWLRKPL